MKRNSYKYYDRKNVNYLNSVLGKNTVKKFWRVATNMDLACTPSNYKEAYYDSLSDEYKEAYLRVSSNLKRMKEFGDNRWWLSNNERKLLYNCLRYNWIIIGFPKFQSYVERWLGHTISSLDCYGSKRLELLEEAEAQFNFAKDSF